MTLKIGSLFAGIGGFDLAARWMGWETSWYSEIDPYASAVMKKQFPGATNLGDITLVDGKSAAPVDLLCGGFPCQDISLAGKGAGIEGSRSGLWAHYARLIDETRPRWVVAENVSALRSRGLDRVLRDLLALGYDAEWHCVPAAYVGAPPRRDRIWIIAHPISEQLRIESGRGRGAGWESSILAPVYGSAQSLADTDSGPGLERWQGDATEESGGWDSDRSRVGADEVVYTESLRLERESGAEGLRRWGSDADPSRWWESEPDVGRVAHGVPSRVDRLRCLGNAIVPQVAYLLFQAIADVEARRGVADAGRVE